MVFNHFIKQGILHNAIIENLYYPRPFPKQLRVIFVKPQCSGLGSTVSLVNPLSPEYVHIFNWAA